MGSFGNGRSAMPVHAYVRELDSQYGVSGFSTLTRSFAVTISKVNVDRDQVGRESSAARAWRAVGRSVY